MAKLSTYERNRRNVTKWQRQKYHEPERAREFEEKIVALTYPCSGEAHRNPAGIDHCGLCAPLWGRVVRSFTDDELCAVMQHAMSEPFTDESYPYGSMEYHAVNEARALGYLTDEHTDMNPSDNVTFFFLNEVGRRLVNEWREAQRKVASK